MKILIKNATIINEGKRFEASLLIKDERIVSLIIDNHYPEADKIIDATGKYLIPGIIDDQVHFRQPGMEQKANIFSESRAAAVGGVTSFMEMPNTNPTTTDMQRFEEKMQIASKDSLVNYGFYIGATEDNLSVIEKLPADKVAGVKIFMGSSTGDLLVNKPKILERIFKASPILIATHCEDDNVILANLQNYLNQYGNNIPIKYHPAIRSAEACYRSSALAVELATKTNANLHILHLSTAKEMDLFSNSAIQNKKITAEVCAHHLWFSEEDYEKKGTLIKWNPAIKSKTDRDALRKALKSNKLDIIATDHAPHLLSEKQNPYTSAPSGAPLVQHSLQIMMELASQHVITEEMVIEKMCHNPAIRYQVKDRGFIRKDYFADLVLIDPNANHKVQKNNLFYKCGWSPLEGQTFHHEIMMTMVNGHIVWENNTLIENEAAAKALVFERN
ncbi:MAG: dihydroorotase [Bacteroidota bacterium]|nr:dihydroorotase [Bacteroidota bacterium]